MRKSRNPINFLFVLLSPQTVGFLAAQKLHLVHPSDGSGRTKVTDGEWQNHISYLQVQPLSCSTTGVVQSTNMHRVPLTLPVCGCVLGSRRRRARCGPIAAGTGGQKTKTLTTSQRGAGGILVSKDGGKSRSGPRGASGGRSNRGVPAPRPRGRPPARGVAVRSRRPRSRAPRGAGAHAEQGFQFLARTSAVPKLHDELARCPETAAAAGPKAEAGAGAATRTGIAHAPARGLRCRPGPAAAPRPSAGRPPSARAWRRQSRRTPGTR